MDAEDDQLEEFVFLDKTALETKLICNICERQLNVTPIGFNEDIGSICGRCISGTTLKGFGAILRQHSLEVLIEHLTFPCTNKSYGCTDVLRFEEVQLHEKNCRFQCTNCPLFYTQLFPDEKCSWNGNTNNLYNHLRTHNDKFVDPPQFDWPEGEQSKVFFTNIGNDIVLIIIKHESATKFICLAVMNSTDLESQCFRYQLELADENKTNSIILRRNRLEPFSSFIDSLQQPEKTLEVDIKTISEMLQNPKKVCVRFSITKKSKKEIFQLTGIKDSDIISSSSKMPANKEEEILSPDEELLMELECPICNEFMVPPIFICSIGHSVCSECRSRVNECPSCRRPLGDGRNFMLEKLTRRLKYPCKNRDIGCRYMNNSTKIKQHEVACELSENSCILKCGWSGLTQVLYDHILEKHDQRIILNDKPVGNIKMDRQLHIYFLFVMEKLFCLSMKNCPKMSLRFNLQHVGYGDTKYKYTIQFMSTLESVCPTLSLTHFCLAWNGNVVNTLEYDSITIPGDVLRTYLFEDAFYYFKVNISEVD